MKLCYIDAFSGIAGDMTIGALLDAGADFARLNEALTSLGTEATFRFEKTKRKGIAAGKFYVDYTDTKAHRHLHHIEKMIADSGLSDRVKANSIAVFRKMGQSESRMHATSIEKVHFHEVGAVDSIADIVGACFCLDNLGIEAIHCSAINVGSGTVRTEHGVLPVPAPATADLLKGMPVYSRGPELELTTPTGAAILATLCGGFGPLPPMTIESAGYGAGDKDFPDHANVVRVLIGNTTGASESTTVVVIETNIDDSTPELLGYAMEKLLEAGALDVSFTPIQMKKNRPGSKLTVVATPENREALAEIVLRETSSLGVRMYNAERRVQSRRIVHVDTQYGPVRVKIAQSGAATPEYDDCRHLAATHNLPLKQVMAEATQAYLKDAK
ncbi:MAG TPA: nickel pincer cofactor biosynthesis protein LarC [Bryobacteraceae bacterium]|nr:nickel pincer cofactor biosynthesis protein LarC [Bryobacteraceae bacterium]